MIDPSRSAIEGDGMPEDLNGVFASFLGMPLESVAVVPWRDDERLRFTFPNGKFIQCSRPKDLEFDLVGYPEGIAIITHNGVAQYDTPEAFLSEWSLADDGNVWRRRLCHDL